MNFNQGSIGINAQPVLRSAPPAVVGAQNGVSIDNAGNVVLGNSLGDPANPAQLLDDREVVMNGWGISFVNPIPGNSTNLSIDANGYFSSTGTGAIAAPGVYYRSVFQGYNINSLGGDVVGDIRLGMDGTSNGIYIWFNGSVSSSVNGYLAGTGISGRGNVMGQFILHGQQYISLRAGGTSPLLSTEVVRIVNNLVTIMQQTRLNIAANRTGTGAVLLRRVSNSNIEQVVGASDTFTTADGKTVTVTDGVITAIV